MHILSQAQLIAFLSAIIGITTVYIMLAFFPPYLLTLVIVMVGYASSVCGLLLLLEIWWYTSIKKTLIQTIKLYKLTGFNVVITCVTIIAWLLFINNLLSIPIGVMLAGILYSYGAFNTYWGKTERLEYVTTKKSIKLPINPKKI